MSFSLFLMECKQHLKSLVYFIYIIVFVLFITGQMSSEHTVTMPEPGMDFYGTTMSRDENLIMENVLKTLIRETNYGHYATYPLGLYKNVRLKEEELAEVKGYIEACTGKGFEVLLAESDEHFSQYRSEIYEEYMAAQYTYRIDLAKGLTYEEFCGYMEKICKMIGKGSSYEQEKFGQGVSVGMTYEEAVANYQAMKDYDRITGTFARLFCDYAGIMLSILPAFIGVSRVMRDKRGKVSDVIYAKSISSVKIILTRFLSATVMLLLPILIVAGLILAPYGYQAVTLGVTPDLLAFVKYTLVWILPEIMVVLALSFLVSELTNSIIGIFIQAIWAYGGLMSASTLVGSFGLKLIPRWNTAGRTLQFIEEQSSLYQNRGFYAVLSLVLIALTIWVYNEKRRKGFSLYGKIYKLRK